MDFSEMGGSGCSEPSCPINDKSSYEDLSMYHEAFSGHLSGAEGACPCIRQQQSPGGLRG